jgi:hypothetical protein
MSFTPPWGSGCHAVQDDMVVKPVGDSFDSLGCGVNLLFDAVKFQRVLGVFVGVDSTGFP